MNTGSDASSSSLPPSSAPSPSSFIENANDSSMVMMSATTMAAVAASSSAFELKPKRSPIIAQHNYHDHSGDAPSEAEERFVDEARASINAPFPLKLYDVRASQCLFRRMTVDPRKIPRTSHH